MKDGKNRVCSGGLQKAGHIDKKYIQYKNIHQNKNFW